MKISAIIGLATAAVLPLVSGAIHPGLLHTNADFDRIRGYVNNGVEPQLTGWNKLKARTNPDYQPAAAATVCRGASWCSPENYPVLYRDAHAAYVNAVYWKVTGDTAYANAAARILDAWSSTLTTVTGSNDKFLVAGIQGYQLANAAEILRTYSGWTGLQATKNMLTGVFLPMNAFFLETHNYAAIDHYWANVSLLPAPQHIIPPKLIMKLMLSLLLAVGSGTAVQLARDRRPLRQPDGH
jgi:hypothetical protein